MLPEPVFDDLDASVAGHAPPGSRDASPQVLGVVRGESSAATLAALASVCL